MDFGLSITATFVDDERKVKYEELGFQFEPNDWHYNKKREPWIRKSESLPIIRIKTLEELMDFVQKHGCIILDETTIEIYDDYRE